MDASLDVAVDASVAGDADTPVDSGADSSVDGGADSSSADGGLSVTVRGMLTGLGAGREVTLHLEPGGDLPLAGDGPFTFPTSLLAGTSYVVSVAAQPEGPDQFCEVTGGSGTAVGSVVDVAVSCRSYVARYAYSFSSYHRELRQFIVDPVDGSLTFLAKYATGLQPRAVEASPDGHCVFVANHGDGDVSAFRAEDGGLLVPASTPTVQVGAGAYSLAIHPSGSHLYVTNPRDNSVAQFDVGADCAPTPMVPATVATGWAPTGVIVSPSGDHVYVANLGAGEVGVYTVGADGRLTLQPTGGATTAPGIEWQQFAFGRGGRHLYMISDGGPSVHQFDVGADGGLTPISPAPNGTPAYATSLAVAPAGNYVWVANDREIVGFSVSPTGALSSLGAALHTEPAGVSSVHALRVDPDGTHLYATSTRTVRSFAIAADGSLTETTRGRQSAGLDAFGLTLTRGLSAVDRTPTAGFAYVVNEGSDTISQFSVDANGGLVPLSPPTVATGLDPVSISVDPSGRFAYVTNSGSTFLSQYVVGLDGRLAPAPNPTVELGATRLRGVIIDPVGGASYVNAGGQVHRFGFSTEGDVVPPAGYSFGSFTSLVIGGLVPDPVGRFIHRAGTGHSWNTLVDDPLEIGTVGTTPETSGGGLTGGGIQSVALHPDGTHVYGTDTFTSTVRHGTVSASGAVTELGTVPCGPFALSVAVAPGGQSLYVAHRTAAGGGAVSQYAIAADGTPSPLSPAEVAAGTEPYYVTVDPTGQFVYVANYASGTVSQYAIGPGGALAPLADATVNVGVNPRFVLVTSRRR